MKVLVDLTRCQAHGECTRIAPDLFELDADLELAWNEDPGEGRRKDVEYAVTACPTEAISIDDS